MTGGPGILRSRKGLGVVFVKHPQLRTWCGGAPDLTHGPLNASKLAIELTSAVKAVKDGKDFSGHIPSTMPSSRTLCSM
jgi:hypothetical protein